MKKTVYLDFRVDISGFKSDVDVDTLKKGVSACIRNHLCEVGSYEDFDCQVNWFDEEDDDDIDAFVIRNQKGEVLARGHLSDDGNQVCLTYRYNAADEEICEKYSGFEAIIAMLPPGTRPTIQFGGENER